jgi:Predicted Zn-dependent peptidases
MKIDRITAPSVNEIKSFNLVEASKQKLSNDINIYKLIDYNTEVVKIEWIFAAGNWFQKSPLIAFAVNNMLIEGSEKYTSAAISETIELYGGQLGYNVDKDNAYVSIVCLQKYLPEILPVIEDIIKRATFPEQELELFRTKHKQQFLVEQSKVRNIARSVHSSMMFGNEHPYGYMITENDFDNLNQQELLDFFRQYYTAGNCKIIVSGYCSDSVLTLINKHFGGTDWLNTGTISLPGFKALPASELKKYIEKPEAVQSAVRIGKPLFNRLHPDFIGMTVLNCVLGGYFGSRLMKKIREEKGYTYGISSLLVEFQNAGYLAIVSELGADVTLAAIEDIYNEINVLRTESIPDEELNRVKNTMLGDMIRMFDGPFAQADSLISLLEYDLGYDYYHTVIETIKSIDSKSLQTLAGKYLDPESFYQVIAGKI